MKQRTIELFGGISITVEGVKTTHFRTQKTAGLLAYLAMRPGRENLREELIDIFWNDLPVEGGLGSLSASLSSLRKILEPEEIDLGTCLITTRRTVFLAPGSYACDLDHFEKLLSCAEAQTDPVEICRLIERAMKLFSGEPLAGRYEDWALLGAGRIFASAKERLVKVGLCIGYVRGCEKSP